MKQRLTSLPGLARLLFFLCGMQCAVAHAAIDIIDGIDITRGEEQSTIHIRFSIPVSYRSHVPERSGDLLRIFVEPLPSLGSAENALLGLQTLQWSPDSQVPLLDVTYEGEGFANSSVTLRFQENVEFEVSNTGGVRSMDVVIKHPRGGKTDVPAMEAITLDDTVVPVGAATSPFPYVINLASSVTPFQENDLPNLEEFLSHRLYTTTFDKDGEQWNRLRLGFFERVAQANTVMERLLAHYPGAWVTKVSVAERIRSSESALVITLPVPGSTSAAAATTIKKSPISITSQRQRAATTPSAEQLASQMQQARDYMTDKDYDGAVRLYTKILQYPENRYSQDALEYLGLARERKGQQAHAKMVYRDYLQRYPEGEGAERVKQRLAALLTAGKQPREKLRTTQTRGRPEQQSVWDLFGGFSQYYRRDENTTGLDDAEITSVSQSSLNSNMDVTGRRSSSNYDLRTRFTGGYLHDFLDKGVNSDTTVSSMYFDARDLQRRLSMRIGRQSRSTGGVLGRFDGLLLGFPLGNILSVSAVGGFPVESSTDSLDDTSRYFYGLTLEAEGFAKGWDANAFVIEQQVDGLSDRRAIGGELRYFDPTRSFFSLVDYDIHYNDLNIWQLLGNWTLPDKTTVNLVADYRKSPILTTSNALMGQNVDSIDELQDTFSSSQLYDLARDRTANSKLVTLGVSRPMDENIQFSGDVTVLNLSGTETSGGVEGMDGTGNDYIYNVQLIGSNLFTQGDITIFGLRYSNGMDRDVYSLNFNSRFLVGGSLRVNPRFRMDSRKDRDSNTGQVIFRPSLRLDYRFKRRLTLEAEIGGEYSKREIVDGSGIDSSYFINVGYRADF